MANVVNPFADEHYAGIISGRLQDARGKKNGDKVPAGMVPLFTSIGGKDTEHGDVIGYADPKSGATVFFAGLDHTTQSRIDKYVKAANFQASKDATGNLSIDTTKQAAANPAQAPGAPTAPGTPTIDPTTGLATVSGQPTSFGSTYSSDQKNLPSWAQNFGTFQKGPISDIAKDPNYAQDPGDQLVKFGYGTAGLSSTQSNKNQAQEDRAEGVKPSAFTPDKELTINDAIQNLYSLNSGQVSALAKQMQSAGYKFNFSGIVDNDFVAQYSKLLLNTYNYQQTGNKVTPDQMLKQQAAELAKGGGASLTHTKTDSQVNLSDPTQARGLITTAMANALGRDPTSAEIAQFTASLQDTERAQPQVTNSSATTDAAGNVVSSNSTQSGGVADPATVAQQWVEQNFPGQVHAATVGTNLFGILASAMGSGNGA